MKNKKKILIAILGILIVIVLIILGIGAKNRVNSEIKVTITNSTDETISDLKISYNSFKEDINIRPIGMDDSVDTHINTKDLVDGNIIIKYEDDFGCQHEEILYNVLSGQASGAHEIHKEITIYKRPDGGFNFVSN